MPDDKDDDRARIYGAPDTDQQQPPPEQGFRGEQSGAREGRADLAHTERTPDGRKIVLEEDSGTAFAEATGRAGGTTETE